MMVKDDWDLEDPDFEDVDTGSTGGDSYDDDFEWDDWGDDILWDRFDEKSFLTQRMKRASTWFAVILALSLISIGVFSGWKSINDEIARLPSETQSTPATTAEPETTATPDSETTATAEVTPTVEITSTPQTTPSGTDNQDSPLNKETLRFVAGQHFLVLSLIIGVFIMIPSFLWIIFSYGQADQVFNEYTKDVYELGLFNKQTRVDIRKFSNQIVQENAETENKAGKSDKKNNKQVVSNSLPNREENGIDSNQYYTEDILDEKVLKDRLSWFRYFIPLILITIFTFASFVWAFWPESMVGFVQKLSSDSGSLIKYLWENVIPEMSPAVGAVLTAYTFMNFSFVRRLGRSDITPRFFWTIFQRIATAFLLGLIGSVIFQGNIEVLGGNYTGHWFAFAIGFLVGIIPEGTLKLLVAYIQAVLLNFIKERNLEVSINLDSLLEKNHPLSLLDDLDLWDQLRLAEEGVVGCQGLVEDDIKHLIAFTPFTTRQIVDWIDQAMIFLVAGAEKAPRFDTVFRKIGMRNASDLIYFCETEVGKRTVINAAAAVQVKGEAAADPLPQAQLAALKARIKVDSAQTDSEAVKTLLGTDTSISDEKKKKIENAMEVVREAKELVDDAQQKIKAGGSLLSSALDDANNLQAKLKSAVDDTDELEKKIKEGTVNDTLKNALKTFGESLSGAGDNDGKTLSKTLIEKLDQIEKPLSASQTKAEEFQKAAKAVQTDAEGGKKESVPQEGPESVVSAAGKLTELTTLLENAKKTLDEDDSLSDPAAKIEELLSSIKDNETDGKPLKLIEKLKESDQWTKENSDKHAVAITLAASLVTECETIVKTITDAAKAVDTARLEALAPASSQNPPLTMEILETLLVGLERQGNIRQVERFKIGDSRLSRPPESYTRMKEWRNPQPKKITAITNGVPADKPFSEEDKQKLLNDIDKKVQKTVEDEIKKQQIPEPAPQKPEEESELMQLPNMTEELIAQLKNEKIVSLDSLFLHTQTRKERKVLLDKGLQLDKKKKIKLNHELILRWVNIMDLTRVPGIDHPFADLLERAGVDSPSELNKRVPKNLREALIKENDKFQIIDTVPTEESLKKLKTEAGKIDEKVFH